ncbi:hypothetical protein RDABS01_013023 [Bienertia sinuspersici]
MNSIHGDKSTRPDGFGSYFYRDKWDIIGKDVCEAVLSLSDFGKLLKELNNTFISLIPKVPCPTAVKEYRLVACCNTVYKCITNMICNKLKEVLPDIIADKQGALLYSRYIIHNIMVCQDLVRRYGRSNVSSGCMIKRDLRKSYYTVEWDLFKKCLLP